MVVSIGAFRRIVEVGWGEMKGDAVLLYSAYIAGGQDPGDIDFSNLPAATTKLGEYNFDGGLEALSYVNGVILFNVKEIKKVSPKFFKFNVRTPQVGGSHQQSTVAYWIWSNIFGAGSLEDNQLAPFTTGDPFGGGGAIIAIPVAFSTSQARAQYLQALGAGYFSAETSESNDVSDAGGASFGIWTYKRRKLSSFAFDHQNAPLQDMGDDALSNGGTGVEGDADNVVPAKNFEVKVEYAKGLVTVIEF